MTTRTFLLFLPLGLLAAACGGTQNQAPPQTITGRIDAATFATPVAAVRAVRSGTTVESPVAPDGSFQLVLPPGAGYRIELVAGAGQPVLVFPRSAGSIDVQFDIRSGTKAFDLGMVRYVGDASAKPFVFKTGETDDGECEDGIDPTTGAVCVDDDDDEGAACDAQDEGDTGDGDGETDDDGDTGDGDGETDDDALPGQVAVAEHNLPGAVGCDDGESDGETADDGEESD